MSVPLYMRIDYSGKLAEFNQHRQFNSQVVADLRNSRVAKRDKILLLVDRGFALETLTPYLVTDHLNLTGSNPLAGPNNPIGERFPVVNDLYLLPETTLKPCGIAAGLKHGVVPTAEEIALIKGLGADFYCYNLVPTALVAAHAGWKIRAMVVPEVDRLTFDELFGDLIQGTD